MENAVKSYVSQDSILRTFLKNRTGFSYAKQVDPANILQKLKGLQLSLNEQKLYCSVFDLQKEIDAITEDLYAQQGILSTEEIMQRCEWLNKIAEISYFNPKRYWLYSLSRALENAEKAEKQCINWDILSDR